MGSRNKRSFQYQLLWDRLKHGSLYIDRATFGVATDRTALATSYSCAQPFLQGVTCNPNSVGLRRTSLERFFADLFGFEYRL